MFGSFDNSTTFLSFKLGIALVLEVGLCLVSDSAAVLVSTCCSRTGSTLGQRCNDTMITEKNPAASLCGSAFF